ncbi:MAG TPA: aspartate kinase [Firmicutes bacterium]|nr:aspartate kinase [Bacillota bacterium]
MGLKVVKFGGTSLASAEAFKKVKAIVLSDPSRRLVIPSAPGRRCPEDEKVTDLLYQCHERVSAGVSFDDLFVKIKERYQVIVSGLELDLNLEPWLDEIYAQLPKESEPDYAASRGEFLNGVILAAYLGFDFVDPQEMIRFNEHGFLDLKLTEELVGRQLNPKKPAVIPGFYGSMPDGSVKTFPRGGSDITGAVIARGVKADLYENWTDVSGFFMTDPRIVPDAKQISLITYRELRELAYNGANVLHEAAIYPVSEVGIPINIRNTNDPDAPGTMIVKEVNQPRDCGDIIGIAGQKDFVVIQIEKALLNEEMGFVRRLLSILEEMHISFAHMPSGIDMVSLVILKTELNGKLDQVIDLIAKRLNPDRIEVVDQIALIATVGLGLSQKCGIAATLFNALAAAQINVRMIDQNSGGINLIVGVDNRDFEQAVKAIYSAFVS